MTRYRDFRPTEYDRKGAFLDDDRQDWIVAPCARTRDSGHLDESNFDACLKLLGGESDTAEVHRFNHWGPGWFEIILVSPSRADDVERIKDKLENYPVLDDEDFSDREYEAACRWWKDMGMRERISVCAKYRVSIFAARRVDEIPDDVPISYLAE